MPRRRPKASSRPLPVSTLHRIHVARRELETAALELKRALDERLTGPAQLAQEILARELPLEQPIALHERGERLADGDVQRAAPAHHPGEEAVEEHPRFLAEEPPALVRQGRLERERLYRERSGTAKARRASVGGSAMWPASHTLHC